MLRRLSMIAATVLVATSAFAANVGEPAPAFSGVDVITGKTISSESLKGKTVVLEWNNFGCPFVKKFYSVGAMQAQQAAAKKDGVVWVSINSSAAGKEGNFKDATEAKAAIAEQKLNSSHYVIDADGTIGKAYAAKVTPHMFVIDKAGMLAYQGAIDDKSTTDSADIAGATNYVSEALAALKAGKPVTTATTKPYGCSVKY